MFLIRMDYQNLFERVGREFKFRCKGCQEILNGVDRKEHHAEHRRNIL